MHVHASMTLAPGKDQAVSDLLARSLPLIARLGWKLTASFRVLTGPTRTILNLWDIPDANAFIALGGQLAKDEDLLPIMIGLEEAMIHNELTLMNQTVPPRAEAKPPNEKTLYLRETVTALAGQSSAVNALCAQAAPLLEKHGFRFLGSWSRATGTTRMLMSLWELPEGASVSPLQDVEANDPEVARIFAALTDASQQIELTPLRKMPFSP